jgi:DNA-binding transcriptional MerR regulator
MTPQQLKELLPPVKTTESSNDNTTNNTEKLYSFAQLGNHFEIHENAVRFYAKENKIVPSKISPAKRGYYKYYKLSDFKNYNPIRRIKKCKNVITNDVDYNYTIFQIAQYYKLSRHAINSYINKRKIKVVFKKSSTRPIESCAKLRHVRFQDFNFLDKQNTKIKKQITYSFIERIKILLGFDI